MGSTQFIYEYVQAKLTTLIGSKLTQEKIDHARDVTFRDEAIREWNRIEGFKLRAIRNAKIL